MKNIFFLAIIILSISCKKDVEELPNDLKIKWEINNPCNTLASNFPPIFYNNLVVTGWSVTNQENVNCAKAPIIAYNKNTGAKIWEWNDHISNYASFGSWKERYVYNDTLVLVSSNSGAVIYAINLSTGETIWNLDLDDSGSKYITGFEDKLFYYSSRNSSNIGIVNYINLASGEREILLEFNYEDSEYVDFGKKTVPYLNQDEDLILFIAHSKFSYETITSIDYVTLYNLTKREIIYSEERNISSGHEAKTIHNDIFTIKVPTDENPNLYIIRLDGENCEPIWEQEANGGIGWSKILLTEDYLYHGSEQDSPKVYKRDINTGKIIWQAEGSGTSSLFTLYDNILYFVGGGDGLLHAVNTDTGKTLLKLESPNYRSNSNAFFSEGISADPETGRVYVGNYISLICYEPYGQ